MVTRKHWITLVLIFGALWFQSIPSSSAISGTNLGTLVSTMQPGTWAELTNTIGFKVGPGYILDNQNGTGTQSILEFADKATWDSVAQRFLFYGAAHDFLPSKLVQYDETTNTWLEMPNPPSERNGNGSHSYQHNAIDPAHRAYFYIQRGQKVVEKLDLNDYTTWSTLPPNDAIATGQCCTAIEWFPEMDGLIWLASGEKSGGSGLAVWKRATNQWQRLAENLPVGYTSGFAVYDPVHKLVLFGGGYDHDSTPWDDSKVFYKVDASGTVTRLPDSPVPLGVMLSVTTVDPASGHLLAIAANRNFYTFDVATNLWMRQDGQTVPLYEMPWSGNDVYDVVATPIPNYGVTMFVKYSTPTYAKIYIYKHATGTGIIDTTPPSVPTGLSAQVASSSQINLSWTASTDNSGVTGYKVFRNSSQIATTSNVSYAVTGLAPGTAYSFSVSAFDVLGNDSAQSTPVSATTSTAPPGGGTGGGGGTGAPGSFEQKCAQAGVLACWPFDSPTELKYVWDNTSAALNKVLAGQTWYSLSNTRHATEGNTVAVENASGNLAVPVIDTSVFSSGGGSLKFTIPSESGPQPGWFQDNFNKVLGNPSVYIAPNSPSGNVMYYQFRLRLNDVMMSNIFREYTAVYGYTLSTPAAGSTTLLNSYDGFTADMAGKKIELTGPHNATPWVKGIYTITSFVDARTVRLDRSPTPSAAASQAAGIVEGSSTAGGWKTMIIFGNAPKGSSSSGMEVTMMNPRQVGMPVMYGQQGYDGYGYQDVRGCTWPILDPQITHNPAKYSEPPCKRFKQDQWVELTGRIEVRGAPNAAESRVQLWVDGELAVDYDKARINWGSGDGDGLGQFDLTPYHTRKDPTQVHATGYLWYDDVIVSTQPIPMANGTTTTAPTVAITSPANSASVSASVTVTASASSTVGVAGVQFKLDGLNLGSERTSAPYSLTWDTAQASNGWHTLTAVARDSAGNQSTSIPIAVLVNNSVTDTVPPTVSITAPNPSATLSASVVISASASDNVAVAGVQFKLDGVNLGPEKTVAPFSVLWDTRSESNGSHSLTAVARDTAGNLKTSSAVTVTVNNPVVPDSTPPTVSITQPSPSSTIGGTSVAVAASASDDIGVVGVQFKLDGVNLGAEVKIKPYSMLWDTAQVPNGTHSLTAVARDATGNKTTSSPVAITVNNSGDMTRPIIALTAPSPNSTVSGLSVLISATAWDNVGITGVQFQLDGNDLGEEKTEAPYSMMWNTTPTPNGSYTLSAVARDAKGNQNTATITVKVSNSVNPSVPGSTPFVRYAIPDQGAQLWTTTNASAPMAVGYARIQTDFASSALAGVSIFSYHAGGVLVSQASVPMSAPLQTGRIFAEINGSVNTGVAFANPGDDDAIITFSFADSSGRDLTSGVFWIGAKRQFSGFLTQAPFNLRDNMEGSFTFTSTRPVSVIALRGLTNERGEFLMTTLPVVNGTGYGTSTVIPHFAVGQGWSTKLVLMNPTSSVLHGRVDFMDTGASALSASPLPLAVNDMQGPGLNYSIPPLGVLRLTLRSIDGELKSGSVRLTSADQSAAPAGLAIFSYMSNGVTVSEAGVPIEKPGTAFRIYAEASGTVGAIGSFQTGIALANTSSFPVEAYLELRPLGGIGTPLTGSVTIPPGGQIARFLKELIPNAPDTFKGLLRVKTTGSVGATGLRLTTNARGDSLVTTIPPATETTEAATEQLFFPHIVAGGGFTTEVVIFSRQPGQSASGDLVFSSKDGTPLPIVR